MKRTLLIISLFAGLTVFAQDNYRSIEGKIKRKKSENVKPQVKNNNSNRIEAQSPTLLPLKGARFYWDASNNQWMYSDSVSYTYNSLGSIVELYSYNLPYNMRKEIHVYDSQNRETEYRREEYDNSTSAWNVFEKRVNQYDSKGNRTLEESYYFDYGTSTLVKNWGNKYNFTYDSNNRITEEIRQQWNTNQYVNNSRETYSYNSVGVTEITSYTLDSLGSWLASYKDVLTYDSQNRVNTLIDYDWVNNTWEPRYKADNITYYKWYGWFDMPGSSSDEESELNTYDEYEFDGTTWSPVYRFRVSNRDQLGSKIETGEEYNSNSSSWYMTGRTTYVFDNLGGYTETRENYNYTYSALMYSDRSKVLYDEHYNMTFNKYEVYDVATNNWSINSYTESEFTYDNNKLTEEIHKYWNSSDSIPSLKNNYRIVYTKHSTLSSLNKVSSTNFEMYPNPASNYLIITSNTDAFIEVLDISGKIVSNHEIIAGNNSLSLKDLSSGVYVIKSTNKKGEVNYNKFIKE